LALVAAREPAEAPPPGAPPAAGSLALALVLALAGVGCQGGDGPRQAGSEVAVHRPPRTAPAGRESGVPALPPGPAAAVARTDVSAYSGPGRRGEESFFPARQPWGEPTAFLIRERRQDVAGTAWYRVLLPRRPNGASGWIRGDQVRVEGRRHRVEIELGERRLTLLRDDRPLASWPVGVGKPGTPTPTGHFFVTTRLRPPRIARVFGAWALGISAWSRELDQFGTGDGQIALHGTDQVSGLGRAVSNGCVRLDDRAISTLARSLPLGSPVTIRP
jgi:lipoprotein-anchoring transpeptidase ErfK/SrfK